MLATSDSRKRKRAMTDKRNKGNNIGDVNTPAKGAWPTIGFRAHPDTIHRYDRAALALRVKRSEFLKRGADELAERVLEADHQPRQGERRREDRRRDPFVAGSEAA